MPDASWARLHEERVTIPEGHHSLGLCPTWYWPQRKQAYARTLAFGRSNMIRRATFLAMSSVGYAFLRKHDHTGLATDALVTNFSL